MTWQNGFESRSMGLKGAWLTHLCRDLSRSFYPTWRSVRRRLGLNVRQEFIDDREDGMKTVWSGVIATSRGTIGGV